MSDREEFEKWYANNFDRRPTEVGYETDICWQAWQAARAQGDAESTPEQMFDHYMRTAIANAPEPVQKLGEYLASMLNEDDWPEAERLLNLICTQGDAEPVGVIAHTSDCRGDDPKAFVKWLFGGDEINLPNGTELYTHPPKAQAVPEGWKLVPIEPVTAWRDLEIGESKMIGDRFLTFSGRWVEMTEDHFGFEDVVTAATRPMQRKVYGTQPQPAQQGSVPEWDGGLPEVGVECEINLYRYWFAATVLAYGKTRFIYEISSGQVDDEGDEISGELDGSLHHAKFRPLKS